MGSSGIARGAGRHGVGGHFCSASFSVGTAMLASPSDDDDDDDDETNRYCKSLAMISCLCLV